MNLSVLTEQNPNNSNIIHNKTGSKGWSDTSFTNTSNNHSESFRKKFDMSNMASSISNRQSVRDSSKSNIENLLTLKQQLPSQNYIGSIHRMPRNEAKSIIFDSRVDMEPKQPKPKMMMRSMIASQYTSDNQFDVFREKVAKVNCKIQAGIGNLEKLIVELRQKKANAKKVKKVQQKQNCLDSRVQLKGSSAQVAFPAQYITFINRLSHQIQLDMDFTNAASKLMQKGLLGKVKNFIINNLVSDISINPTFFDIEPSELDPLQKKEDTNSQQNEEKLKQFAQSLLMMYKDIQDHFQNKLKHNFSPDIIGLLFQQLSKSSSALNTQNPPASVSIGQLLSYLNMRTSTSFRNRFFVKMMKRLNLKPNGSLTAQSLNLLQSS